MSGRRMNLPISSNTDTKIGGRKETKEMEAREWHRENLGKELERFL
jgi:hypothetical protein